MTTQGKLFFDPITTGPDSARDQDRNAGSAGRGTQTAVELKALRAASLAAVSRDLERMLRERARQPFPR
jgi:hypothetical protein